MPQLRDYQQQLNNDVEVEWTAGNRNVLAVLPTGGGKTVCLSSLIRDKKLPTICIAHRKELVGQLSLALARCEIYHRIIAPRNVIKFAVSQHMDELGTSFYRANVLTGVAGIDTLVQESRQNELSGWFQQIGLWVMDEAHHVLRENKWGRGVGLFANALGLGVTATPLRADGKGLGRHASGYFDAMVQGPNMRDLITRGYLSDYKVYAPQSEFHVENLRIGSDGDYTRKSLQEESQRSQITGDIVQHYLRLAKGKRGVTFTTDVQSASEIADAYNAAGVPAAVVSAKTKDFVRADAVRRLRTGELLQLVNVDLFGEGFDLPAIEVISMARPTQSYGLFTQQFGRALRISQGKAEAIIIDHVGNTIRHGLPDYGKKWTLNNRYKRSKKKDPDEIQVRECPECGAVYEKLKIQCPYCAYQPVPVSRSRPEHVDGDLVELDAETIAKLRGEIDRVDGPPVANGLDGVARAGYEKRHRERQETQAALRQVIAVWAGHKRAGGYDDRQIYKMFFWRFGTDVMTAQTLGRPDAETLLASVVEDIPI